MRGIFLILAATLLLGCVQQGEVSEGERIPIVTGGEEPVVVNVTVTGEEEVKEHEAEPEPTALELIRHKEITFRTSDGWDIYGTLYYATSDSPSTAIVLLPALGEDRSSYDELVPMLHSSFSNADVIALDPRGHGKSTNRGDYTGFQIGEYRAMKKDLIALKEHLLYSRFSVENYYIVGSSLGGSVALDYASESGDVKRVVMISPGISYHDLDITEDAETYSHRLYMAVASDDRYSASSADTIYSVSPADRKEVKTYYGMSEHGTDLFDATKDDEEPLLELVVEWLREA